MKILWYSPHPNTIYAGRTIMYGYKDAFEDLGHEFKLLTADDDQSKVFKEYAPDVLFTGLNAYMLKFLDLESIKKQKKQGMVVYVNTPFWNSPLSKLRINEVPSLKDQLDLVKLIKSGDYGDFYYIISEQGDERMEGFEKETGYKYHTNPLAANKKLHFPEFNERFVGDISFIGSNLPDKKEFFEEQVFPLRKKYDLKLYGQGWSTYESFRDFVAKIGMYFNLPVIKNLQKPNLQLEDERRIYNSSKICINVHEQYQREFGHDCNERTFKIPVCGGFEITDDVACIRKYFKEGEEIVIAKDKKDWFEKIDYYMKHPEERENIIAAGRKRVLKDHTYHNRVQTLLGLLK